MDFNDILKDAAAVAPLPDESPAAERIHELEDALLMLSRGISTVAMALHCVRIGKTDLVAAHDAGRSAAALLVLPQLLVDNLDSELAMYRTVMQASGVDGAEVREATKQAFTKLRKQFAAQRAEKT